MAHVHKKWNIKLAFFLNFFFTIFELIGGFLTNSVAIISDAVHDFWDTIAIWMAWYFEKISDKKADKKFTYWYKRFSVLWALLNCLILFTGSIFILVEASKRILSPEPSHASWMFVLAIIWVLVNWYAFFKTHKSSSINEKVVSLHLLEDVLGWVAVLVWSAIMYFTEWYIIDPILSIWITLFILFGVFKNIKKSVLIFLETTPNNIVVVELEKKLRKFEWVKDIHDLHIWSLDWEKILLSVHIVLKKNIDKEKLKEEIKEKLRKNDIYHSTIEFESEGEKCENEC